jgi:acetyltransferase-like isoleucine patch superfamily enzyme
MLDEENIRKRLTADLPHYMVPNVITIVPQMPLTQNGKTDINELRKCLESKFLPSISNCAESVNARLSRVLNSVHALDGIKSNGISEFNSLQAVDLCCAIEKEFNITIGISDVFKCKSLIDLEKLLAQMSPAEMQAGQKPKTAQTSSSTSPNLIQEDIGVIDRGARDLDTYFELFGNAQARTQSPRKGILPRNERFFVGLKNRVFQLLARVAPDDWRCKLHRKRGVRMGENVSIGYDSIIETAYPWLVRIGNHCNIGMRVTIIGHFRGMGDISKDSFSVDIQDFVFVGPGAIILPKVTIGRGAVVAAGSVVNSNVEALTLVRGNPARVIAKCGVPLSGRTSYQEFVANLTPV